MSLIKNQVEYIRERLVRVIVRFNNGGLSTGTGFFITTTGDVLTCFHVVFGSELKHFKSNNILASFQGISENEKLSNYFKKNVSSIEVEMYDGSRKNAELENFNEKYDVVSLKVTEEITTQCLEIDTGYSLSYDESVFFCGFQLAAGYQNAEQYPFSTNRAVVSSFPEVIVGGDKYPHIQLNAINLGGNSGAPLFLEGGKKVIGIVNGNMNMGNDSLMSLDASTGQPNLVPISFRLPLSIAFVTSAALLKDKSGLL